MPICVKCSRKETIEVVCDSCFLRGLEEKVAKEVKNSQKISIVDDNSAGAKTLKAVLEKTASKRRIPFEILSEIPESGALLPLTSNQMNSKFLYEIFFRKNSGIDMQKFIFPLGHILQEDCERFCRLKGISFVKDESPDFIKGLKNKSLNFSLARSREKIDEAKK